MAKTLSTMLDLGSKATSFALPDTNAHTQDNTALASFSFTATANSSEINWHLSAIIARSLFIWANHLLI